MNDKIYLLMGTFNCILAIVVLCRTLMEKKKLNDCILFSKLVITVLAVNVMDTIGWMIDGKLIGNLSLITSIIDALNLCFTASVCFCWIQYVRYLAYDDSGMKAKRNYFSIILLSLQILFVLISIPNKLLYYIDASGVYHRGTGYIVFMGICLIQLFYSIAISFWAIYKVKNREKRQELFLVGLIILLPIIGTIIQGKFYGVSLIWSCMTIVIVLIYIHIQDKRILRENLKQHEQICIALQQAQHASKAKTEFLSNMSHDIRTPMNAIVGFTAIAASHIDEKDIVKDSLKKIMISSNHLLNLINDVLDMSRIESGKLQLQVVPCNLATIIHDLVDMIQSQINANQLELFVDTLHVRDEEVLADPMKISQVLMNIVGNAIKFNKPGGLLSIRIEQKDCATRGMGNYVFTIRDTGTGIAPEYLDHIFEPFERGVQNEYKDSVEGTGLGLAIVKNIVDMMGGTISVTSELGKGSEFKIGLSFGIQSKQDVDANYENLKGLRALVVDDDYDTCDSVSGMLHDIGMEAEWTLTGKEAVFKAKKAFEIHKGYSAFIIDWLIPDMNGIEVTRRIRSVVGKEIPIFILTAYDWTDIEEEARDAGVTSFCKKPLFMSELRQTLAEASGLIHSTKKEVETKKYNEKDFCGKHILLAEDNPMNRKIVERILIDKAVIVDMADNGLIALEKFKNSTENYYDLILMDIRMPKMDGYKATEEIRNLQRKDAKKIPIIALTANAFDEDKKLALEHGMNAHLAKPINIEELYTTLDTYFSKDVN